MDSSAHGRAHRHTIRRDARATSDASGPAGPPPDHYARRPKPHKFLATRVATPCTVNRRREDGKASDHDSPSPPRGETRIYHQQLGKANMLRAYRQTATTTNTF